MLAHLKSFQFAQNHHSLRSARGRPPSHEQPLAGESYLGSRLLDEFLFEFLLVHES